MFTNETHSKFATAALIAVPVVLGIIFAATLGFTAPQNAEATGSHGGHDYEKPKCEMSFSNSEIVKGASTTLSWDSENATSATLSSFGSVSVKGSKVVSPTETTTYTLTVKGKKDKTATCSKTIKVKEPQHEKPVCTLKAAQTTIWKGDSTTLTWTSDNAEEATLTDEGDVSLDGSTSVSPSATKSYTLTVKGKGGTKTCGTTITVKEKPVVHDKPVCTLKADETTIWKGDSTSLTWTSDNADEATLTDEGDVSLDGSKSVSPSSTKTYTLTVKGKGGTKTCATTITVKDKPVHDYEPVCTISASDTSIKDGESTDIHWTSERATSATLTSFGSVPTGGDRTVSPGSDTTYTLTVRDNDGDEDTCSVTINVEEDEPKDDEPWCDLEASESRVDEGDTVRLEWDTKNADKAEINHGVGRVDEDGGSERVEIDRDTTFRMTVENEDGEEDTCSVTVRVDEENELSSISFEGEPVDNPPVVYLSDLPYTGLEDITPSMWGFWLALVGLLGMGSYYVFMKRSQVRA